MPRNTVKPQHGGEADDTGDRIEHAGRAMSDQAILGEIPVGLAVLSHGFVGDRDQDRRRHREAAGDSLPPHAESAAQRALQLGAHIPARVRVADRELQIHTEEPLARSLLQRCDQQRFDRDPARRDQHRRHQRMAEPEGCPVADRARAMQLGEQQCQHQAPDRVVEQARPEPVPRSRLARPASLRALELGHAQLENPARVFLRLIGAEEHALLAPPIENRKVGRRRERRLHETASSLHPCQAVHDAVDQRDDPERGPDAVAQQPVARVDREVRADARARDDANRERARERPVDMPEVPVGQRAGDREDPDARERGRDGLPQRHAYPRGECRDHEDAAADPEQARQRAGGRSDDREAPPFVVV